MSMPYVIIWLDDPTRQTTPRVETMPQSDKWRARDEESALDLAHTLGGVIAPAFVVQAVWTKLLTKELTLTRNPNDGRRALFQVPR